MAKQAHQEKITARNDGLIFEQHSVYDNSLLPPAEELAKLKEINPDIVAWILERASLEQESRISQSKERLIIQKFEFRGVRPSISATLATLGYVSLFAS